MGKKVIFYNTIMLYTILEVTVFTVKMRAFLEKFFFFFKVTLVDQHLMLPMLQCEVCLYLDRR